MQGDEYMESAVAILYCLLLWFCLFVCLFVFCNFFCYLIGWMVFPFGKIKSNLKFQIMMMMMNNY